MRDWTYIKSVHIYKIQQWKLLKYNCPDCFSVILLYLCYMSKTKTVVRSLLNEEKFISQSSRRGQNFKHRTVKFGVNTSNIQETLQASSIIRRKLQGKSMQKGRLRSIRNSFEQEDWCPFLTRKESTDNPSGLRRCNVQEATLLIWTLKTVEWYFLNITRIWITANHR